MASSIDPHGEEEEYFNEEIENLYSEFDYQNENLEEDYDVKATESMGNYYLGKHNLVGRHFNFAS